MDGATELSRTTIFGDRTPTTAQKEAYTRVLLANLNVERIVWPANSRMTSLKMNILSYEKLKTNESYEWIFDYKVGRYLNFADNPIDHVLVEGDCISNAARVIYK